MKLSDIWSSKERHTHMYEHHLGIANCMDYTYDVPQFIEIWKISSRLFNAVATAAAARKNHHLTIDKYPRFSKRRQRDPNSTKVAFLFTNLNVFIVLWILDGIKCNYYLQKECEVICILQMYIFCCNMLSGIEVATISDFWWEVENPHLLLSL